MPTFEVYPLFLRDYSKLSDAQVAAWRRALTRFVASLKSGKLDPRLRIKRVRGTADIWEMSWARDGRATFQYGEPVKLGEPHVVWRRIGTHTALRSP